MKAARDYLLRTILWAASAFICPLCCHASGAPAILITNVPAYGTFNTLEGYAVGANPATQAVAVFIYVPGYGWVSKPTCAQPLVSIQSDGSWSANVTTGGSGDTTATRFAALLVGTNYSEACVLGLANLPTNVYARALAKTVITRPYPGVRFFSFSGYDWWVKNSAGPVGPGPNYFSEATNNVWVDASGWLHLRITQRTNQWQCAEIISARTFGSGSYRFELNSVVDNLNPLVTLGLFTWSDDPAFTDREIDVECSRWNVPADTNNSQFVVQPYNAPNQLVRYRTPAGLAASTHMFVWQTNRINFQSQSNSYSAAGTNLLSSWVFTNAAAVPQSGDEAVHLNLWLQNGNPPSDNNEVEVIVKSFNFVPLGTPPQAALTGARWASNQFQCGMTVQPDYRYQVQSSTNLVHWSNVVSLPATTSALSFIDTNATTALPRFYRAVTLP
jgi:hypothetical protein